MEGRVEMDYYTLGQRIKECRKKRDYTQQELAEQINFSPKHIGNVERGDAKPSIDLLVALANTLNVSLDYLLQDSLILKNSDADNQIAVTIEKFLEVQRTQIDDLEHNLHSLKRPTE